MFSIEQRLFRNLLLLFFGVMGAAWFFFQFPNLHPVNTLDVKYSKEEIVSKADSAYQSWQYPTLNLLENIELKSSNGVLDSLQKKWGRSEFQDYLSQRDNRLKSMLFRWDIRKYHSERVNDLMLRFGLSTFGEVVTFEATDDFINEQRPFNRMAVRHVFQERVQSLTRGFEDSLITGLVNYQHLDSGSESHALETINTIRELRGGESEEVYTMNNIWKLADFYIGRTAWNHFQISRDSVDILSEGGIRFARAYLSHTDSVSGIHAAITVDVLPAGSLKNISLSVEPEISAENGAGEIIKTFGYFIILLFSLWLLVIFYLRIKAKAIDTKPAMVIAVLVGFIVPAFMVLNFFQELRIFYSAIGTAEIINSLMVMGIFGAVSAVTFFVLTAVSDSITRQYWPEKLKTWDLIRSGIFKNKPVGWVILQAFSVGGTLIGLWIITISIIPTLHVESTINLLADNYAFSSIANLLISIFISLLVVVTIFLILANQVIGISGKKWLVPIISAIIFALLDMLPVYLNPWYWEVAANAIVGMTLGWLYLRFDFLTTALGFFIFVNLQSTAGGWVINNSPDANAFYLFLFLVSVLAVMAVYLISKGTDREQLPEYVPAYIEDQTKEQRLKQELSIARVVQQTFLPTKIHHLPGIDIAGTCIPAQETGGDYYDMIPLGESRTAIAIGDVSGKGIRAAFYMTFTKGVLHSLSAIILSPVELLNQLNRLFNENATRGTFISMIYGILEADKRLFTFARAGHNPMLVVRKNGDTEWLQPKGLGIGVAKDDSFIKCIEESTLKLNEGDVIILYTDGITEMLNGGNRFYGEKRLERLVKGVRGASSAKILEIIIDDVNEFKGIVKQHDDMTLVIIKADASVNQ